MTAPKTTTTLIGNTPLKVQHTAIGFSVVCPYKECGWVKQVAVGSGVNSMVKLARKHYRDSGHVPAPPE